MRLDKIQLGEVLDYEQPTRYIVSSSKYTGGEKDTPVLTAGKTFILGYTKERDGVFSGELPVIIFDDFTTATKLVNFPFKVKSSAMKILHCDKRRADIRYLHYLMHNMKFIVRKHKRHWISEYSKILVSLPPVTEQKLIADELDMIYSETEKGLSILGKQKRRVQKIYQTMLSEFFGNTASSDIEWKTLKFSDELFKINTRTIDLKTAKDELVYLDIDAVKSGSIVNPKKIPKKSLPSRARRLIKEGDVLIASVRPYLKSFAVVPKEYDGCIASTGFFVVERNENLEPRYIFHFAMSELFINQTNALMQGGSYPALNKDLMGQISIPIPFKNGKPDLAEQKRIADELEKVSTQLETLFHLFIKQSRAFSILRSSMLNQSFQLQK